MRGNEHIYGSLAGIGIVLAFNLTIGAYCFDYSLYSIAGKDIPWIADMTAGLVLGEIAVPVAIICWIIRLCGVPIPFVG